MHNQKRQLFASITFKSERLLITPLWADTLPRRRQEKSLPFFISTEIA
jgi:hypothetical protein